MKNIAIIENHIISANTVRQSLTRLLGESGYNVTVLSTGSEKEMMAARRKGFNVIDVGHSSVNPRDVFIYMRNLKRALKEIKADIILTFTMRPAIWGNMVARGMGIPTITNITGIGPLAHSKSPVYRTARLLYRFALRTSKKVFFQNEDDLQIFLDKGFVSKSVTALVPGSGVDTDLFIPMPRRENHDQFTFLYIGRLIKDKGILEYVTAAKGLKQKYPEIVCEVLGPYYSQNLKRNTVTEEHIMHWLDEGIIKYQGATDDVRPFIADVDCVVLPSYREGMSNVLLEAASMEKPTIASDTTGCNHIVLNGETGFLCRVKDAADLQVKMEKMYNLSAEQRTEMGVRARTRVKEVFSKRIVTDTYLKAIQEILH